MSSGEVSGGSGECGGARGSGALAASEDEVPVEVEVVGEGGGCCGPVDLEAGERDVVLPKWCPEQSPKDHTMYKSSWYEVLVQLPRNRSQFVVKRSLEPLRWWKSAY